MVGLAGGCFSREKGRENLGGVNQGSKAAPCPTRLLLQIQILDPDFSVDSFSY